MSTKSYKKPKRKMVNPTRARNETLGQSWKQEAQFHVEEIALMEIGFTRRDIKNTIKQLQKIVEHLDTAAQCCILWRALGDMVNLHLDTAIKALKEAKRITPWVRQLQGELLTDYDEVSE